MLKKGKKYIGENIEKEIEAGKPRKQAIAIALRMAKIKPKLTGGKGKLYPDRFFNPKELRIGIKIEHEHTRNALIAKDIAKDHLLEDNRYYTHLVAMEKKYAKKTTTKKTTKKKARK